VAHNAKGYDNNFIYSELLKRNLHMAPIYQGSKLTYFTAKNRGYSLRFIDSLCFIPSALDGFTEIFGITELKKGYFPHEFNKPKNYDYVGSIPADMKYYNPDNMKSKKRADFIKWHGEQTGEWNFSNEFVEYCKSDAILIMKRLRQIGECE
jgi:hypothetical protein